MFVLNGNPDFSHKYGPVPPRRGPMGDMSTPVYGVEGDNKYSIVNERVRGEIVMAGPKYDVEGKSQYYPQTERVKVWTNPQIWLLNQENFGDPPVKILVKILDF